MIRWCPPSDFVDWGSERQRNEKRMNYGVPPAGNDNCAYVQHIILHLAPEGIAGFVLAFGSMSSNQSGEGEIRADLTGVEARACIATSSTKVNDL
jgi:type I restriction enzyme M protein